MAQHDPVDPLVELDALLKQELAVAPSPEFLPRVREAVCQEPGPAAWRRFWFLAPVAAAALLVLATVMTLVKSPAPTGVASEPPSLTSAAIPPQVIAPPAPPPRPPSTEYRTPSTENRIPSIENRIPSTENRIPSTENRIPSTDHRIPSTDHRVPNTEHRAPAPEVLIDTRQRDALFSFIAMARRGQVSAETFATTTPLPARIAEHVKSIEVDDVAVSPIVPGGVLFSEGGRK